MNLERPVLTKRGTAVVAIAVIAFVMGHVFGGRALNAVVVPAVVFLGIGALETARVSLPDITRRCPEHGHVGDTISVRLTIDGDTSVWTNLRETLPPSVRGDASFDVVADARTVSYDLTLRERGEHEIGPLTITVHDFFGLWQRSETVGDADPVIVYPRIRPLLESAGLLSGYVGITDVREQFDSIREYEPGDALRDVNWKASAKRPDDLVVTEYAGEGAHNRVVVGVTAPPGRDDAVAEAAASVVAYLLNNGLAVGIVSPRDHVPPGTGESQRRRLLTSLARFVGGRGDRRDFVVQPDILVHAPSDGRHVRISVDEHTHRFPEVLAGDRGATA